MKLKVKPEDFVVEELIHLPITKKGPYTVLKLQKQYWNTLDVIAYVARKLAIPRHQFSRAGLKDRYSLSTQYLTYKGELKKRIVEKNFSLIPIGKADKAIAPNCMIGNTFAITTRCLDNQEIETLRTNALEIRRYGIPNYFDEQRFGSARHRKGFFARELMLRHYSEALRLILCYPFKEDGSLTKQFKKNCCEHWGHWHLCGRVPPPFRRIIAALIRKPKDFKQAIKAIDRDMLNLYLLAYQSYLFNTILSEYIQRFGDNPVAAPYLMGSLFFHRSLKENSMLTRLEIPMLNNTVTLDPTMNEIAQAVLQREGIELKDFALQKMRFRGVRFKTFMRRALLYPDDFTIAQPEDDEIYAQKKKMILHFTLPPGAYATLVIKRLML